MYLCHDLYFKVATVVQKVKHMNEDYDHVNTIHDMGITLYIRRNE